LLTEHLGRNTAVAPNQAVVWREVDGQSVLLLLNSGRYFTLNETGTHVWRLLDRTATLGEIEAGLLATFDHADQGVWEDLVACIVDLAREDLIELKPA
jgi:Coenzyme PQQ synthesis protein D (PqqD)